MKFDKHIWLVFLCTLLTQCAIDRTTSPLNRSEVKLLEQFKQINPKNQINISDENEPGQKLWLCLTFVSKERGQPLVNQKVTLYHTSSKGEYEPSDPNDESTARLNGSTITDEKGRIFVRTILPGDYGSSSNNRHIHSTVANAHPEAYDIHFKQFTGPIAKNFISGSDQHFLADLRHVEMSVLVAFLTIEVKNAMVQNDLTH